jgi:hypothetical protein
MTDPTSRQRGRSTETRQQLSENNLGTESNIWSQVPAFVALSCTWLHYARFHLWVGWAAQNRQTTRKGKQANTITRIRKLTKNTTEKEMKTCIV